MPLEVRVIAAHILLAKYTAFPCCMHIISWGWYIDKLGGALCEASILLRVYGIYLWHGIARRFSLHARSISLPS